jgi:hypothetical protein
MTILTRRLAKLRGSNLRCDSSLRALLNCGDMRQIRLSPTSRKADDTLNPFSPSYHHPVIVTRKF